MRANDRKPYATRCKRFGRTVVVAIAVAASTLTSGCAHVGAMFDKPKETEQKPVLIKPAAKPKVVVTPAMRAEAEALRTTALEQMSRGAVGPAVSTLTKASKLDPANVQIRRDLERAVRVRNSVASLRKSDAAAGTAALD